MVAEANRTSATAPRRSWIADRLRSGPPVPRVIRKLLGSVRRATTSSLTRRIVILNLAALVALAGGILYLNKFRAGLIDTRVEDRKSTRLNSSHLVISYAVFCLKKNK